MLRLVHSENSKTDETKTINVDPQLLDTFIYAKKKGATPKLLLSRSDLQRGGHLIIGGTLEHAKRLMPTPKESFRSKSNKSSTKIDLVKDDCGVRKLIGGSTTKMERAERPGGVESEWDAAVQKAAALSPSDRGKKIVSYASFDDGSKVAFDGATMIPIEAESTFDRKTYDGGILGGMWDALNLVGVPSNVTKKSYYNENLLKHVDFKPIPTKKTTYMYLTYPEAARVEFDPMAMRFRVLGSLTPTRKVVENTPKVVENKFDTGLIVLKVNNSDVTSPQSEEDPSVLARWYGDIAPVESEEDVVRVADPTSIYRSLPENAADDDVVQEYDRAFKNHFAYEPVLHFLVSAGYSHKDVAVVILGGSKMLEKVDGILAEKTLRAIEADIADVRILNLKHLVQKYIRESKKPFPSTWGKDNRTALRAIETIVQKDAAFGQMLLKSNRMSTRLCCAPYVACMAANVCAEVIAIIVPPPKIANISPALSRCSRVYTSTKLFFKCVYDRFYTSSSSSSSFNEWYSRIMDVRPALKRQIDEIRKLDVTIEGTSGLAGGITIDSAVDGRPRSSTSKAISNIDANRVFYSRDFKVSMDDDDDDWSVWNIHQGVDDNHVNVKDDVKDDVNVEESSPESLVSTLADRIPELSYLTRMSVEELVGDIDDMSDLENSSAEYLAEYIDFIAQHLVQRRTIDPASNPYYPVLRLNNRGDQVKIADIGSSRGQGRSLEPWTNAAATIIVSGIRRLLQQQQQDLEPESLFQTLLFLRHVISTAISNDKALKKTFEDIRPNGKDEDDAKLREQLEAQRERSRTSKVQRFDRISNEDRRIAILLRDTLGDAVEADAYVDAVPDDDDLGFVMTEEFDDSFVIVQVGDEEDVVVDVGENPDEDELDDDVFS